MMAGLPDIIVCYRGVFIALETKMPAGDGPTPRQLYVHRRIANAEGTIAVVRSIGDALDVLAGVDTWLDTADAAQDE